jgi:hypothetical protein
MSNEGGTPKKKLEAGFTSIDNRLMAKQNITIEQKVLLSQVVSMMKSTGRYNASNDYITAITGFNKKTIGKAFKLFNERGWLYHKVIPGGGRWVYFHKEHKANLRAYIGTVEEHKGFLESLRKNFDSYDIPIITPIEVVYDQVQEEPTLSPQGIKIDNIPQVVTASEKQVQDEELITGKPNIIEDWLIHNSENIDTVKSVIEPINTTSMDLDREPTEEELKLINSNKPMEVVYEAYMGNARGFNSIAEAASKLIVDRKNITPLKILLAITYGVIVEPQLSFRYKESTFQR